MAQSLEKAFLQKVAQMPQDELELPPPPPRMKLGKPGKKGRGNFALNSLIKTDYILAKDMSPCMSTGFKFDFFFPLTCYPPFFLFPFSSLVSGGVTTAHQVPAVSQSVYSPPTPETPDSLLSTPPQTHLMKSLPHSFSTAQTTATITGLPPTQPTAKVITQVHQLRNNSSFQWWPAANY